jgi:hypothetical protein
MKAKTYKSTNGWSSPQSLSKFGVPISGENKIAYLGLEEFNFCEILSNFTLNEFCFAFIPSYSTCKRPFIEELHLFYSDGYGQTRHYATLYEVEQLTCGSEIESLRDKLIKVGFDKFVQTSTSFKRNYGDLHLEALKVWNNNFESNTIISTNHNLRFVLNVKYKKVIHQKPPLIVNWANLKRARSLYK